MAKSDSDSKKVKEPKEAKEPKIRKPRKVKEVVVMPTEPIKHALVPKVALATKDELDELKAKFGITRDKLPLIIQNDIAIAFLQPKPGDVVKFTRKSLTTGQDTDYFRLVIAD